MELEVDNAVNDMDNRIEPEREYSLSYLVKNGMFGSVKQFSTARTHVLEDLISGSPVLKASIVGDGSHRTYMIRGDNLIEYLEKKY